MIPEMHFAKIAYDAYCQSTGGVSLISGDKLPEFDALKESIKQAWLAAANAVEDEHEKIFHNENQ